MWKGPLLPCVQPILAGRPKSKRGFRSYSLPKSAAHAHSMRNSVDCGKRFSPSFWKCKVRCWRWLCGIKIPISLWSTVGNLELHGVNSFKSNFEGDLHFGKQLPCGGMDFWHPPPRLLRGRWGTSSFMSPSGLDASFVYGTNKTGGGLELAPPLSTPSQTPPLAAHAHSNRSSVNLRHSPRSL